MDSTHTASYSPQQVQKQIENLRKRGVPGRTVPHQIAYLMDKYPHFGANEMCKVLDKSKGAVYSSKHVVLKARKEDPKAFEYDRKAPEWSTGTYPRVPRSGSGPIEQLATTFEDDEITSGIQLTEQDRKTPDIWDKDFPLDLDGGATAQDKTTLAQGYGTHIVQAQEKDPMIDLQLNSMDNRALTAILNALCLQLTENCKYRVKLVITEEK